MHIPMIAGGMHKRYRLAVLKGKGSEVALNQKGPPG